MPINQTGVVTRGTRQNLIGGLRAKPLPEAAVDAALAQAIQFTETLIETYCSDVAAGEVGEGGNGRASDQPILAERPPTALLYGRVQSGKTASMILISALCLDNNFKIIVVLTTDNIALVNQTTNRFKALEGPRVFSSVKDEAYEWEGLENELRAEIPNEGLVLVCAKDAFHLPRIIRFLQGIDAPEYPALVLDDEADAATPDTTLAARTSGRANAPHYSSTINSRVIENQRPGQQGESIREIFPHSLYVQITATPFVLLLQRADSQIRPSFTMLLEPGEGYCGGSVFFGQFDMDHRAAQRSPIVIVPNDDVHLLRRQVPAGLAASINFFVISACATALSVDWPSEGFKHLSHTSHRINDHTLVAGHVDRHIMELRRLLREDRVRARETFSAAYEELQRTVTAAPPLDNILDIALSTIRQTEVITVNSATDVPVYGPRLNFVVGGNILGRGLTIDDLLVTYYIREAQISQMDTVWQHARMYGYRQAALNYTRVYLPHRVGARFRGIHEAEEELRQIFLNDPAAPTVLIRIAPGTRATRPNATEPQALRVIGAGLDQLHPNYLKIDPQSASEVQRLLVENRVPIEESERDQRLTPVDLEVALRLVSLVAVEDDDPGRWSAEGIAALIETFRDRYNGSCHIYVRALLEETPPAAGWFRGRLNGPEIALCRQVSPSVPTLALLHSGAANAPTAWYPTLVLPPGTPTYLFNAF